MQRGFLVITQRLIGVATGAFFRIISINRHGAVALGVAAGLIGLGVAGFVEVAAGRVAASLVALLGQLTLVEILVGGAVHVLTSGSIAFVVMLILERIYGRLIVGEVIRFVRHGRSEV